MKYIPQLDVIRTIAVLMVLVTHFWTYPAGHELVNRLAGLGWVGVDLFFVLSGFLITRILVAARSDSEYFRNFYARRSLRIFPLYYAVLIIALVALPLVNAIPDQLMQDRWMYFAYLSNFALAMGGWQLFLVDVTWSLSIEEQFYLLWPAVVKWLARERLIALCLAIVIVLPLVRLSLWDSLGWMWLHMMMPLRADSLAMGALVALVNPKRFAAPALLFGSALILTLALTGNFARDSQLVGTIGYSLTALTAAGAILVACQANLKNRVALHVGKVSYGVYLLHPFVSVGMSFVLEKVSIGTPIVEAVWKMIALIIASVAVATISFAAFEQPFLRLKKYFEPGRAGPIAQTT